MGTTFSVQKGVKVVAHWVTQKFRWLAKPIMRVLRLKGRNEDSIAPETPADIMPVSSVTNHDITLSDESINNCVSPASEDDASTNRKPSLTAAETLSTTENTDADEPEDDLLIAKRTEGVYRGPSTQDLRLNACQGLSPFRYVGPKIQAQKIRRKAIREDRERDAKYRIVHPTPEGPRQLTLHQYEQRYLSVFQLVTKKTILDCALACRCWIQLHDGQRFSACLSGMRGDHDYPLLLFCRLGDFSVAHTGHPASVGAVHCIPLLGIVRMGVRPFHFTHITCWY